jgi:V/A-type H+-transporting ATPase subunit D
MELLQTKKREKLAKKGHSLLKKKRDALVMRFFRELKEIIRLRRHIGNKLIEAHRALQLAQALQGQQEIERVALSTGEGVKVTIESTSIMSVKLPVIKEVKSSYDWFSIHDSSVELEEAVSKYRALFPELLTLFSKQLALEKLAEEIIKTKRKVNALEHIRIPALQKQRKLISTKLEELERENFTRLKKIKEVAENVPG